MDLDKHKLWLILGITFAVVILAFLVLYSPLTANFAGEASKVIDSKEINTDTGIKVPTTGTTDIATGKVIGDTCGYDYECESNYCGNLEGYKNTFVCMNAPSSPTAAGKVIGDSCSNDYECESNYCGALEGYKNTFVCMNAPFSPTATTGQNNDVAAGKDIDEECTINTECKSGICENQNSAGEKPDSICVSATSTGYLQDDNTATLVETCTDSDGDNPREGGFVTRTVNGQVDYLADQCYGDRNEYLEYYCFGNEVRVHPYDCLSCGALQKTDIPYCSQFASETGKEIDESTETTTPTEISSPETIGAPAATLPVTENKPGDVNGDNVVDADDALLILQYYVGLIDSFPTG